MVLDKRRFEGSQWIWGALSCFVVGFPWVFGFWVSVGEFGIPRSLNINSIELAIKKEHVLVVSCLGLHTVAVSVVAGS